MFTGAVNILNFFEKQMFRSVALEAGDEGGVPSLSKIVGIGLSWSVGIGLGPPLRLLTVFLKSLEDGLNVLKTCSWIG